MCILLCFGPTTPCATVACHPKFGAAELAHPCPAEGRRLRADLGYVGKFERTWDSERARAKSSGRYRSSPLSKALQGAALRGSPARGARSRVPRHAAAPRPRF